MRWRFSQFAVTNQRLLIREGLIYHRTIGIPLEQLGMLTVRSGVIGRRLGYGTLTVQSQQCQARIRDIRNPLMFYDCIRSATAKLYASRRHKKRYAGRGNTVDGA
jgi:hypothetical protein